MASLSRNARVAGLLYIAASAVGVVRFIYIPNTLFVSGNASATAGNIAAHEPLFRWGLVSQLAAGTLWLFVPLALYRLLKGVDQTLALLMVILGSLMQVPLYFANIGTDAAALLFARGTDFLAVFDKPQRDAFVRLFLNLHHQVELGNMLFAGLWLFPLGVLVYRSRFVPRLLGAWLILAGFGWTAFSLGSLVSPAYGDKLFSLIQPCTLGEVATMLWLATVGAKEKHLAAAA
jgi:hypothetical protein